MFRAIIIEDELNSLQILQQLLNNFIKEVTVVGIAQNVSKGIKILKEKKPDLVFLDIEIPGGDGFTILNKFNPIPFKVIFVTGHDQYALKAIKYAALDYLLKPLSVEELKLAISKVVNHKVIDKEAIHNLEHNLSNRSQKSRSLIISNDKESYVVNMDEIMFLQANGSYVSFILEDGRKKIASYSIGHYEQLLPPEQFFRTHKSYIVNCQKIRSVNAGRGGVVILKDGTSVPISFRRKSSFVQLIKLKN